MNELIHIKNTIHLKNLKIFSNVLKQNNLLFTYSQNFDIDQNKVVSAEALVRLEYPGHGLIMPNKFIPTLKKNE